MGTNRIVTCRWGKVYSPQHVDKLYDMVNKNCSVPFEFHCFDELDKPEWNAAQKKHFRGLDDPDMRAQGAWSDFERDDCGGLTHYRKLLMFAHDTDSYPNYDPVKDQEIWVKTGWDKSDRILFLDLDVLVLKDLSYFFDLDHSKPWIVKSYWFDGMREEGEWQRQFHLRRCPYFNSSVLTWSPTQNRRIYDTINENLDEVFFTYGVNDNFMFHLFGPWAYDEDRRNHFNVYPPGIITSQQYTPNERGIIHSFEGMSMKEKEDALNDFEW